MRSMVEGAPLHTRDIVRGARAPSTTQLRCAVPLPVPGRSFDIPADPGWGTRSASPAVSGSLQCRISHAALGTGLAAPRPLFDAVDLPTA